MSDLLKVNINERLEKKGNLSYLSWAHAWGEALRIDPAATFDVHTFDRGDGVKQPYMDCNGTAIVWVSATLNGKTMTCQLPVMNHQNKAIPNPDAFAVNTAMMRCMVKALALHGLGLYVYAGEDLPDGEDAPEPKPKADVKPASKPAEVAKPKPAARPLVSADWKMQLENGDDKEWADSVSAASVHLLEKTISKAEVMEVFKVNRTVFDKLKSISKFHYDELMVLFKSMKEKRE